VGTVLGQQRMNSKCIDERIISFKVESEFSSRDQDIRRQCTKKHCFLVGDSLFLISTVEHRLNKSGLLDWQKDKERNQIQ